MRTKLTWMAAILALIGLAAAAPPARAASGIEDNAHFFSHSAIQTAGDLIRQTHSDDSHDIYVVTYDSIPDSRISEYQSKGKSAFFEGWAEQIGREQHVQGVVILMTRTPGHLQVVVGNKTRQRAFTIADRQTLTAQMLAAMHDKRYDEALVNGVRFIKEQMDAHMAGSSNGAGQSYPPVAIPPGGSSGSWGGMVCLGVGILVVFFLIMRAAGNRSYGQGPGYNAGQYPPNYGGGSGPGYGGGWGGGGGGFGRGLLGGLLGGALGAWGYDELSGRRNNAGAAPPSQGGFGASPGDQEDTSYSGGGGDFDSSNSSGGDFGSGGGDSGGGGDFGGGGGDFGGGGDSGGGGGGGDF